MWRSGLLASAALAAVQALTLMPYLRSSSEIVRLRNALLLHPRPAFHAWTPAGVPADFALDRGAPLPLFVEVAQRQSLRIAGDDWATALAIAGHLLSGSKNSGQPIQSNLADTYHRIVERGEGHCGDLADVFTGLANAVGLFSRTWAFSVDGFGGRGHIFHDVWDGQHQRWAMLDLHNNFHVVDASGRPLSAMEFREKLLSDTSALRLVPIAPSAPRGFAHAFEAYEYYRAGLPQWYLWWGTNVVEYDRSNVVRVLAGVHRAAEQLGAVAAGVHPRLRVFPDPDGAPQRTALERLRWRLLALVGSAAATIACGMGWVLARRRAPKAAR